MTVVPSWVEPLLWCPDCRGGLVKPLDDQLACVGCRRVFPVSPVPTLLSQASLVGGGVGRFCDVKLERRRPQYRQQPWIGDEMVMALPSGALVLSVGEGYGEIALRLAERHPDLYFIGVDLARDRVADALAVRKRLALQNVWFCVADARCLPFVNWSFEAGYARGLLHILPDPLPALAELRRVLRSRLLVDQLANRPFFVLWFWLLQRYEMLRARIQRRPPDRRIWADVVETLQWGGTYQPLWRYRRWFSTDRGLRMRTPCLFIWETGKNHPLLGWLGYAGAIDVWL